MFSKKIAFSTKKQQQQIQLQHINKLFMWGKEI